MAAASWGLRWPRLQRLGALALVPLSLGVVVLQCGWSPEVPFLRSDPEAPWMMAPTRVSALLEQWGVDTTPVTRFSSEIQLEARPDRALLVVRALRHFTVRVNGEVPDGGQSEDGTDWRVARPIDVAPLLLPGANRLEIDAVNRRGPGLLSVRGEGIDLPARSEGWQVFLDDVPLGAAIAADDTRLDANAFAVETPFKGLVRSRDVLLLLFVVGAMATALAARRDLPERALPVAALSAAVIGWLWLFADKLQGLPLRIGFDARAHLDYLEHLQSYRALPLATDGWSMYHPPLFYVIGALLQSVGDVALKLVPWLSCLGMVFLAHAFATRLHRGRPKVAFLAVAFAAVLPLNLYSAAYVSNEPLHALLAGLALLRTVDALLAPSSTTRQMLAIGLWLGLAALTKFTVLALVPVALFFLALKLLAVERATPARAGRQVGLVVATGLAVAGWFYLRNQLHFGVAVLGNWALPGDGQVWWQQPGFHTLAYYTGFGESLRHAYFAGFASLWDGLYSTAWGDGYIAGRVYPHERHAFWSYDLMSAGYLLALPVTALLVAGIVRGVVQALRDPDPGRRAALSFLLTSTYAIGFALLSLTLSLPFFTQAKATYALCLVPVLSVFFASAAADLDELLSAPGWVGLRLAFAGLLSAALGCFFLGFAA